ncbi:NADPH-dependent FMN reductase [Amycolatopsis nigrescens]|uniref:NADPH-dependent FMN reductase n=1 Tax=Amycolatopsis nigrescens TaxID=381445 RepID=UPI000366F014|nr:NAD(P)H-dependent oxidoreductase [Amycolatopsis nigrescens]
MPEEHRARLAVAVIIGSTRDGRVGGGIGHWVAVTAGRREDMAVEVVDLLDFEFPSRHPDEVTPEVAKFTAAIDRAEAFVVVTPEYNRSFPASLKQAIDYGYDEWHAKPVGFVSYGCRSGGLYAVEQLRVVCTELHMVTMRNGVSLDLFDDGVDDCGLPLDDGPTRAAETMLDQLAWWGRALRDARAAEPYVA